MPGGSSPACDIGLDFHTSTRNRTTIYHARADLEDPDVTQLARAFAANEVLYGEFGSCRAHGDAWAGG